ncbi:MAG: phosphoribosylamine--glycine ligase [Prosthecochloris sp.]|uniref:Phosphoribosylamine--glycine ligase n=1 Tax=Prosthecochloris aestuarii (strain DSM 271 / SK 413) TaxID=290512 RepID=B4S5E6_PROA2|nr:MULTISPECIES: phosphoribosylamine--glycine ligase [Prosthecochloris]ACF45543.1 phosphoribosylamine/glycine ligase [Prosthecochloris aestuarii DSM 271]MCW8797552.1 phosphoribosylamine--glycine ligase [Prosthecochloris sp.]NEX11681.1 phosphoribosylamine--glycine ligase [Prosthecochloris sp.]RDD30938.1 phosphoribosylamine--glycine ligase [Prosthecochloris sp. ZM]
MKVLVIGSGAREHALVRSISNSQRVGKVFAAPGNGGTAIMGGKVQNVALKATDIEALLAFVTSEDIDLTVVGPEQPLEMGIVDRFRSEGLSIIGPDRYAAQLETSKVFSKDFMLRYSIPTADYQVFTGSDGAGAYLHALKDEDFPRVIKASGLCAGKGVVVAANKEEALQAVRSMFDDRIFGDAANEVVIESFLKGEEASVFVLTDGTGYRLFRPAQDHKRIGEGDSGKNTGGMGAYAPAPVVTDEVMRKVEERIVVPALEGMRKDDHPYTGFLYVGLMIDNGEPSVVEFNVRLGDPEAQVVLPLLQDDLVDALTASLAGTLDSVPFTMLEQVASTVVLASGGYPDAYAVGKEISIDLSDGVPEEVFLFHAGTTMECDKLKTSGGRVISVTALGSDLKESLERAYDAVGRISFDGMYFRRDIGAKAL